MKKVIFALAVLFVLVSSFVFILDSEPAITAAVIRGQTKCVNAETAAKLVNEAGCVRLNENDCEEGLVKISC